MKRIVGVIPCHLNSIRLKRKVLLDLYGLPMLEHVRRRALKSKKLKEIYIATGDKEIIEIMKKFGSNILYSKKKHKNGTTRVAEGLEKINCSHVILIQGDEPLLKPEYIDTIYQCIEKDKKSNIDSWNLTAPLKPKEIFINSVVKCDTKNNYINSLFRRRNDYNKNLRKILGIIAYKKEVLTQIVEIKPSNLEKNLKIEQLRILENNFNLKSIKVRKSLQSINIYSDISKVKYQLINNKYQNKIYKSLY